MFDSLMVKINDRDIELQTKRFENKLGRYHPGDAVCGAPGGGKFAALFVREEEKRLDAGEEVLDVL